MPADPAPSDSLTGTLGEFRIAGVLGEGGSGRVYDAVWGHRRVALKVLRRELVATPGDAERFANEAALLQAVDHPGVVKVLGAGTLDDGRPWLAMERLEGETLAARIARGPLPAAESFDLLAQLAAAVHALHRRGLVHRDVKPENVMLVRGFAVLLDFGIAKDQATAASTTTQQGGVRGTPAYMAPERFFGAPASVASDVYELAVTGFAMLTGRLPWEHAADPTARLNPPRPSQLGAALPAEVETVLMQALSTRAETRPTSAQELGRRIVAAASGAGAMVPRATAELGPPGRAAAPAPDVLPQVTPRDVSPGALAPTVALGPSRPQPQPPQSPPGHRGRIALVVAGVGVAAVGVGLAVRLSVAPARAPATGSGDDPWGTHAHVVATGSGALRAEIPPLVRHEAPPGWPDAALALHADDIGSVLAFSPKRLYTSAAVQAALADNHDSAAARWYAAFVQRCGVDPLTQVDQVTIGVASQPHAIEVVARGTFSRDEAERCLAASLGAGAAPERRGPVTKLVAPGQVVWLGWADAHTVLAEVRDAAGWDYLATRLAHTHSLRDVPAMTKLLAEVDVGGAGWAIVGPDAAQIAPELGVAPPSAMFASLDITGEVAFQAGLRYPTSDAAHRAAADLGARLEDAKQDSIASLVLGDTTVAAAGNDARFAFHLGAPLTKMAASALIDRANQSLP